MPILSPVSKFLSFAAWTQVRIKDILSPKAHAHLQVYFLSIENSHAHSGQIRYRLTSLSLGPKVRTFEPDLRKIKYLVEITFVV